MFVFATYAISTTFVATPSSFTKLLVVFNVSYPLTGLTPPMDTRPNHKPGAVTVVDVAGVDVAGADLAPTPRRLVTDLPVKSVAERLMLAGT
jgi:hypothetical protein